MHRRILNTSLFLGLLIWLCFQPALEAEAIGLQSGRTAPLAKPSDPPLEQPAIGYFYTIRSGDTLWDIASAHTLTVEELLAANAAVDPQRLLPGQYIFVPAAPVKMPSKAPLTILPAPSRPSGPVAGASSAAPVSAPVVAGALPPEMAGWPGQLVAWMNEKRVAAGAEPLIWSAVLSTAAQAHAEDCQRRGWGSHVGSDGASLRARLTRIGYPYRWAGENWANMQSPSAAFALWWNEPPGADPHRANILNPMYREVGVGIVKAPWGYYFFTDFGSR